MKLKYNNQSVVVTEVNLTENPEDSYIASAHYEETGEELELQELIELTEDNLDVILEDSGDER